MNISYTRVMLMVAAGWPPGAMAPPGQQPGAPAGFMQAPAPAPSQYTTQPAFQPPPSAALYQYAGSPPAGAQPPPANGQLPPAAGQPVNPHTYAPPASQTGVGAPRPGFPDYGGMLSSFFLTFTKILAYTFKQVFLQNLTLSYF